MATTTVETAGAGLSQFSSAQNTILDADRIGHDWYRFVLSFLPHFVRRYVERFGAGPGTIILDPFCATGATILGR